MSSVFLNEGDDAVGQSNLAKRQIHQSNSEGELYFNFSIDLGLLELGITFVRIAVYILPLKLHCKSIHN